MQVLLFCQVQSASVNRQQWLNLLAVSRKCRSAGFQYAAENRLAVHSTGQALVFWCLNFHSNDYQTVEESKPLRNRPVPDYLCDLRETI